MMRLYSIILACWRLYRSSGAHTCCYCNVTHTLGNDSHFLFYTSLSNPSLIKLVSKLLKRR
ncbi:hypothetical protein ECANGB1_2699 [Enterospora canceri]|uniref:Secreted protein n=1 Tax=Enterospora canceri TaxID=1081671 RepID=A0A1Y1S879_9MICR|nr:hypothetical protein ECANGB1_2699 [Enterospora canceri]